MNIRPMFNRLSPIIINEIEEQIQDHSEIKK
jgi:hypothetical protein